MAQLAALIFALALAQPWLVGLVSEGVANLIFKTRAAHLPAVAHAVALMSWFTPS